jgi:CRISPR-associated endonuclease Csn1
MIMPVELMDAPRYLADAAFRTNYALGMIGKIRNKKVDSVVFPLGKRILKINTVISLDGFRMCLAGKSSGGKVIGLSGQMPFIADYGTERYIKRMRSLSDKIKNNPKYVFSSESDKISSEENIRLYDRYVEKLQKSTFSKHPTHPLTTLLDGRDTFLQLSPLTQMSVLLNIHAFFGRSTYGVDLREINGSGRSAVPGLSSVLSNWKKRYADIRIIDQSASGLWETKSQNLLDLL